MKFLISSLVNLLCLLILIDCKPVKDETFPLSLIHFNDFHARYEEINNLSGPCVDQNCIGGLSRLYQTAVNLIQERPNPLFLNAGDSYQGTFWYNVFKWNVTQYFMNKFPLDASTLGNHEFDDKLKGLVPYLKNLKTPTVVSNIDYSKEPSLYGLFNKSIVIERNGKKIGIIGVVTTLTPLGIDTGKLVFLDEIASVNTEAERLVKEEKVFTNIVLSHCGYEKEIEIAGNSSSKISAIVGGHTHTFLYTGDKPPGPDEPSGPYPTVIKNKNNQTVLVVQASSYTKYLGNLSIFYNDLGNIVSWEGAPIFLSNDLPKNDYIDKELIPWQQEINEKAKEVVGRSSIVLPNQICRSNECELGNFVTDAMVIAYENHIAPDSQLNIAIIHAGGIRSGLEKGNITFEDVATMFPFESTIDTGVILGWQLKDVFENCVATDDLYYMQLFPVAGLKLTYNLTNPIGRRLTSLQVKLNNSTYEDIKLDAEYTIIVHSFLATSGYWNVSKYLQNRQIGDLDTEIIVNYLKQNSPISPKIEGRIIVNK